MRWHLNHLQRYATGFFLTCWVCLYLTPDRTGWPKLAGKQPGINDTYWDKMSWKYVWLRTENCLNSVFCICGSQTHIYVYIYIQYMWDIPRHPKKTPVKWIIQLPVGTTSVQGWDHERCLTSIGLKMRWRSGRFPSIHLGQITSGWIILIEQRSKIIYIYIINIYRYDSGSNIIPQTSFLVRKVQTWTDW